MRKCTMQFFQSERTHFFGIKTAQRKCEFNRFEIKKKKFPEMKWIYDLGEVKDLQGSMVQHASWNGHKGRAYSQLVFHEDYNLDLLKLVHWATDKELFDFDKCLHHMKNTANKLKFGFRDKNQCWIRTAFIRIINPKQRTLVIF